MTARLLSTAVIVGAFLATPALAADPTPMANYMAPPQQMYEPEPMVSGQLQLYGGGFDGAGLVGGRGSANVMLPGHLDIHTQLDLIGVAAFDGGHDPDSVLALAHFYKLNAGASAYGIFLGGGSLSNSGSFVVGLEGQHFWGPFTVGADVAYIAKGGGHGWAIGGYAAYYHGQNTKFQASVGYQEFSGSTPDAFELSGLIAHRFAGSPFGVFGQFSWFDYQSGGDATQFLVGLTVDIDGGNTRIGHDRSETLWTVNSVRGF